MRRGNIESGKIQAAYEELRQAAGYLRICSRRWKSLKKPSRCWGEHGETQVARAVKNHTHRDKRWQELTKEEPILASLREQLRRKQ